MKCPRCTQDLTAVKIGGVTVDACQDGCGGIWFDLFELEKMDQPDEPADWLLEHLRVELERTIDRDAPVSCPRCDGITLMRQKHPHNAGVEIDKCPVCGGTWLDFGELYEIRASNPPASETRAATAALLRGLQP